MLSWMSGKNRPTRRRVGQSLPANGIEWEGSMDCIEGGIHKQCIIQIGSPKACILHAKWLLWWWYFSVSKQQHCQASIFAVLWLIAKQNEGHVEVMWFLISSAAICQEQWWLHHKYQQVHPLPDELDDESMLVVWQSIEHNIPTDRASWEKHNRSWRGFIANSRDHFSFGEKITYIWVLSILIFALYSGNIIFYKNQSEPTLEAALKFLGYSRTVGGTRIDPHELWCRWLSPNVEPWHWSQHKRYIPTLHYPTDHKQPQKHWTRPQFLLGQETESEDKKIVMENTQTIMTRSHSHRENENWNGESHLACLSRWSKTSTCCIRLCNLIR